MALVLLPFPVSTMRGGLRGTAAGCAAASRWLGVRAALLTVARSAQIPEGGISLNDRMLAWAVALEAAPDVPNALAPAQDGGVWTAAGGRWRQVRVSSRPKGPTWTRWPTGCHTLTGRVIRRWKRTEYGSDTPATYCHLAVDDGRDDLALVWKVGSRQYKRCKLNSIVQVTIDHKGRLVKITKVAGPGDAEAPPAFDEYVAWYSWAGTSLSGDAVVCHAAAAAATHVLAAGGDRDAATLAAHDAAMDEATLRQTKASYNSRHSYVERFI